MTLFIGLLVSAAFAALLLLQWRKAELRRRAEQARTRAIEGLIDRFRDSEELVAFARSEEGRLLLGTRNPALDTARLLLSMMQAAVLLAALGAGFLATALTTPPGADINLVRAAEEARYWGTMCLALALGIGVAFAFSQGRARKWGLLPG